MALRASFLYAQISLLTGSTQEIILSTGEGIGVAYVQGQHLTPFTFSLAFFLEGVLLCGIGF